VPSAGSGTGPLGGGGGGTFAASNPTTGGGGNSGRVILRLATADYTSQTSGSPQVSTSGDDTILIYNGSGSYTA